MSESLTLNEYQSATDSTAIYPGQGGLLGLNYAALEAAGEAGEIANKVKKLSRDSYGGLLHEVGSGQVRADDDDVIFTHELLFGEGLRTHLGKEFKEAIAKEVGGALYGLARVASELGMTLGEIAQQNLDILASRKERNVLGGSGDDR